MNYRRQILIKHYFFINILSRDILPEIRNRRGLAPVAPIQTKEEFSCMPTTQLCSNSYTVGGLFVDLAKGEIALLIESGGKENMFFLESGGKENMFFLKSGGKENMFFVKIGEKTVTGKSKFYIIYSYSIYCKLEHYYDTSEHLDPNL